jgi:5-methylcytosine-specific restriction endonuclease McrA
MTTKKRDYAREYKDFHGKPEEIKARAERNAARDKMGLKVGDKREVDHKNPLSKGGSNSTRNLRVVSQKTNRSKGAKRK